MRNKIMIMVVAIAFIANAESPVKVKVEVDKEATIELIKSWGSKIKDKVIELTPVVKEKAKDFWDEAKKEREENINKVEKKGVSI